jgi:NAD+--dinitrogen-reductase ADP-D-ribosyltransferase
MGENGQKRRSGPSLPAQARLPVNRCNLPSVILGSLTFQRHPGPLEIDGVRVLHKALFADLERSAQRAERATRFMDYMDSAFLLGKPDEAGLDPDNPGRARHKVDYRRLLRGWLFDSDGAEAVVLKGWVESRFGLLARKHGDSLRDREDAASRDFGRARSRALYNTNALEAQLDLLFSYCQFEAVATHDLTAHLRLYRGINRLRDHEILARRDARRCVVLLNNLSSFSGSRERADEFGDTVIAVEVPVAKLLYFPGLLPGQLHGEDEYLVIGGLYEIERQ